MKTLRRGLGILSALVLLPTTACVGPPDAAPGDMGSVQASLQLSPTAALNTASYSITGPNAYMRSGTVDVSRSQTISFTVGGLPPGSGYSASISGTANDGVTTCSGSGPFSITAGTTTVVMIRVQCREPVKTGSAQINGTVNVCPVVDAIGANPAEVMVGAASALSAAAHDSDGRPGSLTYSWTATSGMLGAGTTANPTLFCTAAGTSTVTLTVSDGDCTDTGTVSVVCSPAPAAPALVRINEVESNGGTPGDWVELVNVGGTTADLSGWRFRDNDPARVTAPAIIPAGTLLPPGGYYVLNEVVSGVGQFNFGLGAADSAILTDANDAPVDSYSWTAHAATTYGRCPNGSGAYANTASSTKGAANDCPAGGMGTGGTTGAAGTTGMAGTTGAGGAAGMATLQAWPGDGAVATADGVNQFTSNLSGLNYQAGTGTEPDVMWAIQNGPSTLYRLVFDAAAMTWVNTATDGWAGGKTIRYPNGLGGPDSEGVTRAEDGSTAIYVSTERDNDDNGVSRLSILRFDTSAPGTELIATHEWNITADLPAVGPNLGLEAIAWVPDTYLVASGFIDETTLAAYEPTRYPNHGAGIFFVGVEANGMIHGYALDHVGGGFTRVASLSSGQPGIMDLGFDRDAGQLWAYCDNTCANKATLLGVTGGRFQVRRFFDHPAGLPDANNEGFTFAPESQCVSGRKAFFWSDDSNVNMHALRRGAVNCGNLF